MKKDKKPIELTQSMEDYLRRIIALKERKGVIRVKDISRLMNVKPSSVTAILDTLSKKGLVIHKRYGYVKLTPEGEKVAKDVEKRHDVLIKFLTEILEIDLETAKKDACKMEHTISPQTFRKLMKFIEFVKNRPIHEKPEWLKSFEYYFKTGERSEECKMRKLKKKPEANKKWKSK